MALILKATYLECIKIFSKWRTYIGFITIAILIPVIMLLVRKFGFDIQDDVIESIEDSFFIVGSLVNGLIVSYYLMNVLWVHFPFFIILVAADVVAGEGAAGTFRILLTRPISRFQVTTSKFFATSIYTALIVVFMGVISLGVGMLIVGGGDLLVFDKGMLILSQGDALFRFLLAYILAILVQMVVASLAFFFSNLANNSIGPIIATYAVIVVSLILSVLKIDALNVIKPYLFTTYFDVFFAPFSSPIPWQIIGSYVIRLGIFVLLFYFLSVVILARKDIKT